ncbi:MAG: sugar phosphate nucleotidyltransferase, partial [Candidatus Latescibacteria bacterium]|nr:sugar phosphate nucleotidyltransferase [Candidatus Latescibacterota bacterium]
MKFVIRAGGIGTRLWPFSRKNKPKQFHALAGERTMLQEAVSRLDSLATMNDLYVSTGTGLVDGVHEQLPDLAADNLIVEPALRNTGPAVGLECALLEARFPGCTIASLGSDHHIGKPKEFCRLLKVAEDALEDRSDMLFTLGVKPTRIDTGFGYIQKGNVIATVNGEPVYAVEAFKEKPDAATAKTYVESGQYLWNSNMFVWKAKTILDLFAEFEPEIYALLAQIESAAKEGREAEVIAEVYPHMKDIAIDNAIIERAPKVATIEADIDWSDIGAWGALTDVLPVDGDGNLFNGNVLPLNVKNSTVYGGKDKMIALVDVEDLIVVDTGDALLILPRDGSQRVKDVVAALGERA